ncbi:MAG: recombination protein RecR [Bacilli bacterium]|nr:recombination protein RecR [Bacilli bacterium]
MYLPKSFENLVKNFEILPGVGEKTAERFVYSLKEKEIEELENLAEAILHFKNTIQNCSICGCISDEEVCEICKDEQRDKKTICIVEDSKSVFSFEKTNKYKGLYHVLNGLISPIEDINPEDLNLSTLINKRITKEVEEIIIAINPCVEGEITSLYIQKLLENKNIKVSRLSYGIPVGTDIEYLDPIMITKALDDRKFIS